MFPVSDVIPSRTTPVVTIGLIVAGAVAFIAGARLEAGEAPLQGPVLLSPLLHAGWLHLAGNTLSLWIFGDNVESALGRAAYLLFFAVASLIGAAAHGLVSGVTLPPPGAGAPIAAVLGTYFVLYPRSRVLLAVFAMGSLDLIEIPALYILGVWVLVQALAMLTAPGMVPVGVTVFAPHAAALAFGGLVGLWLRRRVRWRE